MIVPVFVVVTPDRAVFLRFLFLYIVLFSSLLKMYQNIHAAFWSASPSTEESRDILCIRVWSWNCIINTLVHNTVNEFHTVIIHGLSIARIVRGSSNIFYDGYGVGKGKGYT